MKHNGSLGRGLASLIPTKIVSSIKTTELVKEKEEKVSEIPVAEIKANPMQPRHHFDHASDEELINSIKEHGIIQPLIVTKTGDGYELIAGERRLRSARILDLKTVPAIIRSASQQQKLEVSLIENIQRQDLNPIDEARAYEKLLDEFSLTQEQLAKRVGKNRATIANLLRILALPQEIQKALIERKITVGHAKLLLALNHPKDQMNAFKKILRSGLNVQETTQVVQQLQPKKEWSIDYELLEKEEKLRTALSTKVKIERRGKHGKITIEFYSPEELDSLIKKLTS